MPNVCAALTFLTVLAPVFAQQGVQDGSYFTAKLYPILENAQCRLCHNDNGVASNTRLRFPREAANAEEIRQFGLGLEALVDRQQPDQSLLFRKPTNRAAHTGGERIRQGTADENVLRNWVAYLATLNESELQAKRKPQAASHPSQAVRGLTHSQYNNTVRDLLGAQTRPADQFPKEDFVHGFTNQVEGQNISPLLAEAYNQAAERLARNAFRGDTRGLIPCHPAGPADAACREKFIRSFGVRAFRRPLSDAELNKYVRLHVQESARTRDFVKGSQLVVEVMLQSPHFLFHLETGSASNGSHYRTASRLSYFLWDSMPDEQLFAAAAAGRLGTPEEIRSTVLRMLESPRARLAMDEFLGQWLRFDRLRNAIRDRRLFPEFSAELVGSMQEETSRLFRHLVWEDGNFLELFTADYTFLSASLAQLYGVRAPAEEFARVGLATDSGRAGILGQASFLTLTSKPTDTSPTERGLFVREHFLCQQVPPPPPGVDTTLPALTDEKPMAVRQRLDVHLSNAACAACHRLVDPIGFGLEHFDAVGRFRQKEVVTIHPTLDEMQRKVKTKPTEYALEIDPAGVIQGIDGAKFSSPRELGHILAQNVGCQRCVVKQLFRYATGRRETGADQDTISAALEQFRGSQFRFKELIIAIATSRAVLGGPES